MENKKINGIIYSLKVPFAVIKMIKFHDFNDLIIKNIYLIK